MENLLEGMVRIYVEENSRKKEVKMAGGACLLKS